jgi:hypothetical protein
MAVRSFNAITIPLTFETPADRYRFAQQLHQELRAKLKEKDSLIGDIEDLMSQ